MRPLEIGLVVVSNEERRWKVGRDSPTKRSHHLRSSEFLSFCRHSRWIGPEILLKTPIALVCPTEVVDHEEAKGDVSFLETLCYFDDFLKY